ncbi:MAG: hypothetical protein IJH84_18065 [Saccharopolyspora sp.]|uniref:hypothetical protein n=1 Tax=unclassified Saccharopolyspora TaxID=2646250 RepID=UPI0025FAA829|nr:hypothetical protein [Saccharopolyspora sp.]MBQ6642924.1 hypothetical protein [Saccharopolyspora sp.]
MPNPDPHQNIRRSKQLPPYRAVFAVDVRDFSSSPSAHQEQLSKDIPQLLSLAFEQRELGRLWDNRVFGSSTGDGYYFGVDAVDTPFLVDPFLGELQEVLEAHDEVVRARSRDLRLRLRASVHIGPVPEAGPATAMNETHRLLDSEPVRAVLADSDPDVTFLAAILSERVYTDVVAGDYVKQRPSQFAKNALQVKSYLGTGYLYTPKPSANPQRLGQIEGLTPVQSEDVAEAQQRRTEPDKPQHVHNEFSGNGGSGIVIQAGRMGDVHGPGSR